MGLFGKLDAANIPTNFFYVAAGDYSATITVAEYRNKRDQSGIQLHIEYQIDDPDSEFLDSRISQYFDLVDPDMTEEEFDNLPADEKKKIRKTNSSIKRTLCGSGRDDQPGLGVTEDNLNDPEWDPKSLVNSKVDLTIYNYGPKNEGVGIRYVNVQA